MRFGRRRFLQLLAATGAALASREVPGLSQDGPTGPGTSAGTELTGVVYPPSPEGIRAADLLVTDRVESAPRYWALGEVPGSGGIYIGGVRVGSIRNWSWDRQSQLVDFAGPGDRYAQYRPVQVLNYVQAEGTFTWRPDPLELPFSNVVTLELQHQGATYLLGTVLTEVDYLGRDFKLRGEGYNVQTKLG